MVMVMHLYSAFSMCIYLNALYNTLWWTLPDCFMAQFTNFFNVTSRIERCPQNRMSDARPQEETWDRLLRNAIVIGLQSTTKLMDVGTGSLGPKGTNSREVFCSATKSRFH